MLAPNSQKILSVHLETPFTQLIKIEPTTVDPVEGILLITPIDAILVFVSNNNVSLYSVIYFI